jgi:DNA sulfur modification protein DndC
MIVDEIWYIINTVKSPWDLIIQFFLKIYADASADYECPTVVDKEHSSCGQSRFGCWTCTVVKNDKSMTSLVNNGQS